jgi:non-specific serine/threonine protein kinase
MVVTSHLDELQAENHKVLVFSSFVRQLNLYQEYCQKSGYAFLSLTGKTPQKERHSIVQEFQTNSEIPFFFISLKSGGFGLNLQVADYVMLLDPWWNPQAENQAIDRAHRIGQNKHVHVYRYISKETVEEKIQILQERKRGLSNEIIDSNTLLRSFDIDELKNLLS